MQLEASQASYQTCSKEFCEYIGKSVGYAMKLQTQLTAETAQLVVERAQLAAFCSSLQVEKDSVAMLIRTLADRDGMAGPAANTVRVTAEIDAWISKHDNNEAKSVIKKMWLRWHPGEFVQMWVAVCGITVFSVSFSLIDRQLFFPSLRLV